MRLIGCRCRMRCWNTRSIARPGAVRTGRRRRLRTLFHVAGGDSLPTTCQPSYGDRHRSPTSGHELVCRDGRYGCPVRRLAVTVISMTDSWANLARKVMTDPVHFLAFRLRHRPVAGRAGHGRLARWRVVRLADPGFGLYASWPQSRLPSALPGIWICGESARRIGVHDHGGIVWDEIAGMYVTLVPGTPHDHRVAIGFRAFQGL